MTPEGRVRRVRDNNLSLFLSKFEHTILPAFPLGSLKLSLLKFPQFKLIVAQL